MPSRNSKRSEWKILAARSRELRDELLAGRGILAELLPAITDMPDRPEFPPERLAAEVAQALIAAAAALARGAVANDQLRRAVRSCPVWGPRSEWLVAAAEQVARENEPQFCSTAESSSGEWLEAYLAATSPRLRRERGLFLTPPSVARALVGQLQQTLADAGRSADLAMHILDPAAGCGALIAAARASGLAVHRWTAWEISLPAYLLQRIELHGFSGGDMQWRDAMAAAKAWRPDAEAFPVVLANPPYLGAGPTRPTWIDQLLRGRSPSDDAVANYYEVDGAGLKERKLWLQDDYIRFLRLAHWRIEQAGHGAIAFLLNPSLLESPSCRGLRESLLTDFSHMRVSDVQPNRRRRADGNGGGSPPFAIGHGVAILTAVRAGSRSSQGDVRVVAGKQTRAIVPRGPHYRLSAARSPSDPLWERSTPLPELMPCFSTAIVTARDRFAIAPSRAELVERLKRFIDPSVSDDELRATWFTRTRSSRYPPGDSRGWKLPTARARLRETGIDPARCRRCLYRPWDWRWYYDDPAAVDWPRSAIMRELGESGNLALITRRQFPPEREAAYFWIADCPVIDGAIRSDNRGSESVFPLWLQAGDDAERRPNLSAEPLARLLEPCGLAPTVVPPEAVLCYIYATWFSPEYRGCFADALAHEFPRIPPPPTAAEFWRRTELGAKLATLHLTPLESDATAAEVETTLTVGSYEFPARWLKQRDCTGPEFAALTARVAATRELQRQCDAAERPGR